MPTDLVSKDVFYEPNDGRSVANYYARIRAMIIRTGNLSHIYAQDRETYETKLYYQFCNDDNSRSKYPIEINDGEVHLVTLLTAEEEDIVIVPLIKWTNAHVERVIEDRRLYDLWVAINHYYDKNFAYTESIEIPLAEEYPATFNPPFVQNMKD